MPTRTIIARPTLPALAALALLIAPARAQVSPVWHQYALSNTFTLGGTDYTNPATAALAYTPITLLQGRGCSLQAIYLGKGATCTTGMIGLGFAISVDGTNYNTWTNELIWHAFKPNGAKVVYTYTNIPAAVLDNARYMKLVQVTNNNQATNQGHWLSNVVVGIRYKE